MVRHMIEYAITDGDIAWLLADQLACRQHAPPGVQQEIARRLLQRLPFPSGETGFKPFQQIAPRLPFSAA